MVTVIVSIADAVLAITFAAMAYQVARSYRMFKPPRYTSKMAHETDLPSVTVCIPARNEEHALTDCLEAVLKSTYERLEIIVLDDVSNDDTSALIKSFASEGVRFVKGSSLVRGWIGKNHALQGLYEQSSGSYILFVDVDTRLSPHSIESMVRYALSERAAMVSVMPQRVDGWRASIMFSPLRFFWEIILYSHSKPAAVGNAWMIRRDTLKDQIGTFAAFPDTLLLESALASQLAKTNEYRFLMSTSAFGVNFEKRWRSQVATSIRLLYPLFGSQGALSVLAMLDLLVLLFPYALTFVGVSIGLPFELVAANALLALSFALTYGFYARRVWRHGWIIAAILWPYILVQESVLIVVSAIQHKRGKITWRGRPIRQAE